MVKRPFTARALTVIPLAKFAFVIITPTLVYQMNHCSVLLLTLTAFPLMMIFFSAMRRCSEIHCTFCTALFQVMFALGFVKSGFPKFMLGGR